VGEAGKVSSQRARTTRLGKQAIQARLTPVNRNNPSSSRYGRRDMSPPAEITGQRHGRRIFKTPGWLLDSATAPSASTISGACATGRAGASMLGLRSATHPCILAVCHAAQVSRRVIKIKPAPHRPDEILHPHSANRLPAVKALHYRAQSRETYRVQRYSQNRRRPHRSP